MTISILHLLWIIPISAIVGIGIVGIAGQNSKCERESRIYKEGFSDGYNEGITKNTQKDRP